MASELVKLVLLVQLADNTQTLARDELGVQSERSRLRDTVHPFKDRLEHLGVVVTNDVDEVVGGRDSVLKQFHVIVDAESLVYGHRELCSYSVLAIHVAAA